MSMEKIKKYKPNRGTSSKVFGVKKRKSARQKGYDSDWDKYRFRFLHYNKVCYCCGDKATVVDHLLRVSDNPDKFSETTNHLPMCASCHSIVTQKFDRAKKQDVVGKMKWIDYRRRMFGISVKVKVLPYYKKEKAKCREFPKIV